MSSLRQFNFSSGEISPDLYSRVDLTRYATGLKKCKNWLVQRMGGVSNRPGTEYIGEVKDSSKTVRLIPFVFNTDQTYILEFGDQYVRFIKGNDYICDIFYYVDSVSQTTECLITAADPVSFANGDEVTFTDMYVSDVSLLDLTELTKRTFIVSDVSGTTFKLKDRSGNYIDSTAFRSYAGSSGIVKRIYEVATEYREAHLAELKYIQSADVIVLTHQMYPPAELSRNSETSWSISTISFVPTIAAPSTGLSVTNVGAAGVTTYEYAITSIAEDTGEESLVSATITTTTGNATLNSTNFNRVNFDAIASGASEYNIYRRFNHLWAFIGVSGGANYEDTGLPLDSSITPPDGRDPFAPTSSGTISSIPAATQTIISTAAPHGLITGDLVYLSGIGGMTELNDRYFFVSLLDSDSIILKDRDGNDVDSTAYGAYTAGGSVYLAHNFPATCSYYQQRLCFANSINNPEMVETSRTSLFHNFTRSQPVQSDDGVKFQLVGKQVNSVNHLVDLGKLALFTQAGEWTIEGDNAGTLVPTDINPKQRSYNGSSSRISPIVLDNVAVYLQSRGSVLRTFNYDFVIDGYRGTDLTIFSNHLFDNYTMLDMAYQKIPHSNLWIVRSDGILLGLTHVPEQNIVGWHQHEFENGLVENVAVVPEDNFDALYLVIKRTINGQTKRYIEKMSSREFENVVDSNFVDSMFEYDGRFDPGGVAYSSFPITMTAAAWTYGSPIDVTCDSGFNGAEIGDELHVTGPSGDVIRLTFTAPITSQTWAALANRDIPADMQEVALTDYTIAKTTIRGLYHLEGQSISATGDGFVISNPNNPSATSYTVSNGQVTFNNAYSRIKIGLPITADIETLSVDTLQGETISDKRSIVSRASLFLVESRGLWVGQSEPESGLTGLFEMKFREFESMDSPVDLFTGTHDVVIEPNWRSNGRIFIRQTDPVPATVSAIVIDGMFPLR